MHGHWKSGETTGKLARDVKWGWITMERWQADAKLGQNLNFYRHVKWIGRTLV